MAQLSNEQEEEICFSGNPYERGENRQIELITLSAVFSDCHHVRPEIAEAPLSMSLLKT